MSKERNYGIDLLRVVLMYMVCMLHTLGRGGILGASAAGTRGYKVFWFLEILSYCAVDGFAIISGYMANDQPRKFEKLVDMWFQAFFYSFIVTMILTIVGINDSWSKADMIKSAMPVTFGYYWYFTAFFALYFSIPVLNSFLFSLDSDTAKKAFIIIVILYSFLGVLGDPFYSNGGYSAIWLMVLYCIGVLAKKIKLFETRRSITLILLWALCIVFTWVFHVIIVNGRFTNLISPTILLSGILMVVLFSRIRISGTIIQKISPLTFGIYLFQLNAVIWNILENILVGVVNQPLSVGVPVVFAFAFALFASGLVVEYIRSRIAKFLGIPAVSKRIVTFLDAMIGKLFVFLK